MQQNHYDWGTYCARLDFPHFNLATCHTLSSSQRSGSQLGHATMRQNPVLETHVTNTKPNHQWGRDGQLKTPGQKQR